MTVKHLKDLLRFCKDDDRIILDNGERVANSDNEVIFAYKVSNKDGKAFPVVVLQTRKDFDVPNEIEAQIESYNDDGYDEADALSLMFELGFNLDDFKYDGERYEWASRVAREHGLV